ncbi:hypothetical protein PD5205_04014 (plasmid) [Xanthomonas fragariae]|uniref:Uncharacterized protein n=1 Tax=Xanthomonas fragariae TaxID=48664 RepID=A0A1Y6HCL5_9XANT|nr:hypothetical protein PD885_04012 [Xanthomonas fragariae]SMR06016.1 hypothetical protein PD5205_04014 [Xanthomonas fragariae]
MDEVHSHDNRPEICSVTAVGLQPVSVLAISLLFGVERIGCLSALCTGCRDLCPCFATAGLAVGDQVGTASLARTRRAHHRHRDARQARPHMSRDRRWPTHRLDSRHLWQWVCRAAPPARRRELRRPRAFQRAGRRVGDRPRPGQPQGCRQALVTDLAGAGGQVVTKALQRCRRCPHIHGLRRGLLEGRQGIGPRVIQA